MHYILDLYIKVPDGDDGILIRLEPMGSKQLSDVMFASPGELTTYHCNVTGFTGQTLASFTYFHLLFYNLLISFGTHTLYFNSAS